MYYLRKLKPDRDVTGLIPAFVGLAVFAVIAIFLGMEAAACTLGIIFVGCFVFAMLSVTRTGNRGYLVQALYLLSFGLFLFTSPKIGIVRVPKVGFLFLFCAFVFGFWMGRLALTRRLKWRGREILELAAMPVEEATNGYTGRPRPGGKSEYTKNEVMAFGEYCLRNLIAWPYLEKDRLVLVPVMMGREFPYLYWRIPDYRDRTWVAFGFDGNVTVNVSKNDYLTYKEDLAFDPLCESLGDLFVEFLDLFRTGNDVRIIDRMNNLQIAYFS